MDDAVFSDMMLQYCWNFSLEIMKATLPSACIASVCSKALSILPSSRESASSRWMVPLITCVTASFFTKETKFASVMGPHEELALREVEAF